MAQEYSGHVDYSECYKYARRLRNAAKRRFAFSYLGYLRNGAFGPEPLEEQLSVMGRQAVRMNVDSLVRPLTP